MVGSSPPLRAVGPILLFAAISLRALRGPLLAWRVLPAFTVAAAM
jgi:hypothetical protein